MIEKITDHNLERYDSRLKEWCDRKFFEKGNYGKYETTEEAGAVAFYPAPNTPLEGKVKFSFKETMPTTGDKSPDNPSTISGISNVAVSCFGKNLIGFSDGSIGYDIFTINSDKSFTINGTTTGFHINFTFPFTKPLPAGNYRLSFNNNKMSDNIVCSLRRNDYNWGYGGDVGRIINGLPSINYVAPVEIKSESNNVMYRFVVNSGIYDNLNVKLQLESGTVATVYEPVSRVTYTFPFGNTYYGGEIDLVTGLMTVTWGNLTFTSTNNFQGDNGTCVKFAHVSTTRKDTHYTGSYPDFFACSMFPVLSSSSQDVEFCRAIGSGDSGSQSAVFSISKTRLDVSGAADPSNPTNAEWLAAINAWLAEHPVTYYFKMYYPTTVQLTSTQILSLLQTDKYTPRLNTVYTDADSVQISYLKSPIRDEYEKTQAILSLGGNS